MSADEQTIKPTWEQVKQDALVCLIEVVVEQQQEEQQVQQQEQGQEGQQPVVTPVSEPAVMPVVTMPAVTKEDGDAPDQPERGVAAAGPHA